MSRPWQPLLVGAQGTRAAAILDEIVAALRQESAVDHPSLERGAGRALLWGYLDRAWPDGEFAAAREAALDRVVEQLAAMETLPTLFGGFVGAAWVVDHFAPADADDPVAAIDAALLDHLAITPWSLDFDLTSGLAGIGVYALGRLPAPTSRLCLERVVDQLASIAEPRGPGLAWLSRPELRLEETRARWPRGYYNHGVAHGAPAVALVLAGAAAAGIARARPLLDGVLRWQWAGQRVPPSPSAFDFWEQDGVPFGPARLAWCYGDAGVATTLYAAARAVGDAAGAERALAVARASTGRSLSSSGVEDAGLCHGSAGLALLYARLAHETGEALFAAAARRWYAHLLDQYTSGEGPADDASFLTGSTGIALALLAGLAPVEPAWDRLLAASLPPTGV